jgi:hypothetical protein
VDMRTRGFAPSDKDFCSDDGSGYNSAQPIRGSRDANKTTGIRVKRNHFNTSGKESVAR